MSEDHECIVYTIIQTLYINIHIEEQANRLYYAIPIGALLIIR